VGAGGGAHVRGLGHRGAPDADLRIPRLPLAGPDQRGASLHDDEGFFPTTTKAALERVDAADARAECRAQLETALSWGVDVTHLDAHMNVVQSRTDLYEIYLDLAEEFRLQVRMLSREDTGMQGFGARERALARGLLFNEHIVSPWPRRTRDVFSRRSRSCRRA
jgi:chitin disaccharide deacetylase